MSDEFDIEVNFEQNGSMTFEIGHNSVRFPKAGIKINNEGLTSTNGMQIQTTKKVITHQHIKIGDIIGQGVSSYVCRGLYIPYNCEVALKIINVFDKDKRHQMLNDLSTLLNGIECEQQIKFYGAYYEEGTIRLVLEYMDQGSLRSLIEQIYKNNLVEFINEQIIATITYNILLGLQYLHKQKHQLHRDIKPENILINSQGQIKLTDFGISKQLENTIAIARTFVGTLMYMSPERTEGKNYSYASDIWSLGLIIYELATGKHPYAFSNKSMTYIQMIQSILKSDSPKLDNHPYSLEMKDFLNICLNKDQNKRLDAQTLLQHNWILKNVQNQNYVQQWIFLKDQKIKQKLQQS
ncbi:unnamed protein product [Paramecium sonneborni]|uniref:mitogen-activated protein kinase kinase n=1 Tax=Paramecium sonneborni TaxID=65129 RepID=A0A8S1QZP9_9CILI|nr:unnamed protein product [Paramecium sonneborni]